MATLATGGTITTNGDYTIHTFTASGTFTTLIDNLVVDYLIVGGAGVNNEGGSGGGEVSYVTGYVISNAGANTVTVGNSIGAGNTTFITTAVGGGAGGLSGPGGNGACGGGGGFPIAGSTSGGIGSVGFNGGDGLYTSESIYAGGGGGGMGGAGGNAVNGVGGAGGDGVQNSISGAAVWYGGGRGGGGSTSIGADGQGWENENNEDGIVIVRYLTDTTVVAGTAGTITGAVTITNSAGETTTLTQGSEIPAGATITTGEGSLAQLTLAAGAVVTLQAGTSVLVTKAVFNPASPTDDGVIVRLLRGVARFVTGLLPATKFSMSTQNGAALGIRN